MTSDKTRFGPVEAALFDIDVVVGGTGADAEVFAGTMAFLAQLRAAGVKTALCNGPGDARAGADGIADLFDAIVEGGAADARKALDLLGVAPERAIAVVSDVSSAAGESFALVVAVDRETHGVPSPRAGADLVVADLAELAYGARDGLVLKTLHNLPSAFDEEAAVRARLAGKRIAVFLDYDGTLTPIVEDPQAARFGDAMRDAVVRIARVCPTAIVSGRDLPDVQRLVALSDVYYAGSHGFDMAGPGGWRETVELGRAFQPHLARAADALEQALAGIAGASVERKSFSLAVHWRRVAAADEPRVFEAVERTMADFERLRLSRGKKVFDVKPRADWHKGRAILALLDKLDLSHPDVVPIYLGDDTTDEDAFRAIADRGLCVVVRSEDPRPTAAHLAVDDVPAVARFLDLVSAMREGE